MVDRRFYLLNEALEIATAMFPGKVLKWNGRRIVFAFLAHAVRCEDAENVGMFRE